MQRPILLAMGIMIFLTSTVAWAAEDYRIVVVGAKVLPVKKANKCWDPCMPGTRTVLSSLSQRLAGLSEGTWNNVMSGQTTVLRGSKLPDPYVILKFSNGQMIKTHVIKNSLSPQWGTTERVSLSPKDTVYISVRDKDLNSDDLIGEQASTVIPHHLLRHGGIWKLRFQRVFELELMIVKGRTQVLRRFLPGLYEIAITKATIASRKASGRNWDAFRGYPDPYAVVILGKHRIVTKHKKNTLTPVWNHTVRLYLNGDEQFRFYVFDKDITNHDLIGSCFFNQLRHAPMLHRRLFRWKCKQVEEFNIQFKRLRGKR